MADWAESGRVDEYWFELVDPFSLAVVKTIDGIPENSSITYGYETDNLSEADLDIGFDDYRYNGRECMIRVMHRIELPSLNEPITECLGTFWVVPKSKNVKHKLVERSIQCYGPMYRLTQDYFADDYVRNIGQTVVGGIKACINYAGGNLIIENDVDQERRHTKNVWFQVGSNRAECLRTICGWANLQFENDDYGEIRLKRYIAPRDKPVSYIFEAGFNCTYLAGYTEELSDKERCNRVVAWWSRDKIPTKARKNADGSYAKDSDGNTIYDPTDSYGLSDRYLIDLPDGNPLSYRTVGRRMTYAMEISEPCSHEEIIQKATDYLNEHSVDTYYIEIEHVGIPNLRAGQVVQYQNTVDIDGGIGYLCEITQMDISLDAGCMTKTKMKILGETPVTR